MKDQKEVWNAVASSWDTHRTEMWPSVLDFLKKAKGKVLDLGCGSGRNFMLNPDQELYAVDFSPEMIKLAQEDANFKGIDAKFFVANCYNLEFSQNFFDAILCWSVLHCLETEEKRRGTLQEIYRVLTPGGKVLLSTWGRGSKRIKNKDKESMVPWTVDGVKKYRYTYIYDLEELEKDLREIGFVIEDIWENQNINAILSKPE